MKFHSFMCTCGFHITCQFVVYNLSQITGRRTKILCMWQHFTGSNREIFGIEITVIDGNLSIIRYHLILIYQDFVYKIFKSFITGLHAWQRNIFCQACSMHIILTNLRNNFYFSHITTTYGQSHIQGGSDNDLSMQLQIAIPIVCQ